MKKLIYLMSFVSFLGLTSVSHADGMNFTVKGNIPSEQEDQSISYYDLKVEQDIKEITSTVTNQSDQEIKVKVLSENASSNPTGSVDYTGSKNEPIKALPFKFSDVVKPKEEVVTLAAGESKDVVFEMDYPKESFKGIVAGGLFFQEVAEEKEGAKATGVQNTFSRSIAVLLRGEKETAYKLDLTNVKADLYAYKPTVMATLTNTSGKFINHTAMTSKITKQGSDKALYTKEEKEFQLASYSDLHYPFVLENDKLKPGKYTLYMELKADDEKWSFEKDFEITSDEAKDLNKDAILDKKPFPWMWVLVALMVTIILGLIGYIVKTKKS